MDPSKFQYGTAPRTSRAGRLPDKEDTSFLIVGEMDRDVDLASTMEIVNALIKADKDSDLLMMRGVGPGAAKRDYADGRLHDFLCPASARHRTEA